MPKSYLNRRRPSLQDAVADEGRSMGEGATWHVAIQRLEEKGYFTPQPRPWKLGAMQRGLGSVSYAVLDRFGDVVLQPHNHPLARQTCEHIIKAVNILHVEEKREKDKKNKKKTKKVKK